MPWKEDVYKKSIRTNERDEQIINSFEEFQRRVLEELERIKQNQEVLEERLEKQSRILASCKPPTPDLAPSGNHVIELGPDTITQDADGSISWVVKNYVSHETVAEKFAETTKHFNYFLLSTPFTIGGGYGMQLLLYPNGTQDCRGQFLSLCYALCYQPDQDNLVWPFKRDVQFTLRNQYKPKDSKQCTLKCARSQPKFFEKPKQEKRNTSYGKLNFIAREKLVSDKGFLCDDEMHINVKVLKPGLF